MLLIRDDMKIYLRLEPTDMRKSINTLAILVSDVMSKDPASGHMFLFRNKKGDKIKVLYYEQNAFSLWYRRLETGKYIFPKDGNGDLEMTREHFKWLFASDKFSRVESMTTKEYSNFF